MPQAQSNTSNTSSSIQIFKAGKRISNDGTTYDITADDVAGCASCYDPKVHEAPLVIGHPKTDDPAWGWVAGLQADGAGDLSANFSEVDAEVGALVGAGRYKKVSASFYPPTHPSNPVPGKWYLRHVGLLGAVPPAVKGLSPVNFADGDGCVEFSEYVEERAAGLFRKIRDWMIGKFGQEEADGVISNWEIESMNQAIAAEQIKKRIAEGDANFSEHNDNPPPNSPNSPNSSNPPITHQPNLQPNPQPPEQENTEMTEQEKAANARAEAAEAELAQLKATQAAAAVAASHQANADFAEGLVTGGKVQPAHKALITQALDYIEHPHTATADFGEGDAKKPLATAMREFLAGMQVKPIFGALATVGAAGTTHVHADFAEADPESLSHHQRASNLAAKEGISYEDAARRTVA